MRELYDPFPKSVVTEKECQKRTTYLRTFFKPPIPCDKKRFILLIDVESTILTNYEKRGDATVNCRNFIYIANRWFELSLF